MGLSRDTPAPHAPHRLISACHLCFFSQSPNSAEYLSIDFMGWIYRNGCPSYIRPCFCASTKGSIGSQRQKAKRLGYGFCPLCLAEQRVIHVLWEWCFACVTRCSIHRTPLQTGCPSCGESDPLTFEPSQGKPNPACWSCGDDLSNCANPNRVCADEQTVRVVEDAYRAALRGVSSDPSLLGKVSHRAFRKFVDDMLELLVTYADPKVISHEMPAGTVMYQHRAQLFALIADLISNAVPSSDVRCRRLRESRSLKLWTTLLALIPRFCRAEPWKKHLNSGLCHCRGASTLPFAFKDKDDGPTHPSSAIHSVLDFSALRLCLSAISVQ